jgi:glycosyltransferase involved in cell wall biosynthesis
MTRERAEDRPLASVTVVIPTRNRRDLLGALLRSLERQSWPAAALEVIVVDNASADGTESMVARFAAASRLRVQYHRKDYPGPAQSRDYGLRIASGEIVAFIDSDCVATPRWIEAGVAAFGPGTGLVQGCTRPNPDQPRHLLEKTIDVTREGPLYETCNIFYLRSEALGVGGFSAGYGYFGEDTDLAWKVKRAGFCSAFAEDAVVYHHVFKLTLRQWLLEPCHAAKWPLLARQVPELRQFLYRRYFLFRDTALFDLALLGVAAGLLVHPAPFLLAAPYFVARYRDGGRFSSRRLRMARAILGLPRAAVLFAALAYGSIRRRALVI